MPGEQPPDLDRTNRDRSSTIDNTEKSPPKNPRVSLAAPRFWHGMRFTTYVGLLWQGRFRIHYSAIGMMVAILFFSIANSLLSFIQWLLLGRKIANTAIEQPPLFIVGHWRSGTTLVHELLSLDDHLSAPTTYECFAPSHFLISESILKPLTALTIPRTRPMDNMASGPDRPQEDEFAICALGAPSPYAAIAFPNQPRVNQEMIDLVNVGEDKKENLRKSILFFAKSLTYRKKKRLLLKSPTHTGRIEFLRQVFPGARFLHICRDPKDVIPSTVNLWQKLESIHGYQIPRYDVQSLENHVGATFCRMYQAFALQTQSTDDIYTLKYEEVVANPVDEIRKAYEYFGLKGFENLEPKIREHIQGQSNYKRNRHRLNENMIRIINENCADYLATFGYEKA